MKVLLDTNAYVGLMRGDERVMHHIRAAEVVYLSSIVVGELLYGFRFGSRYAENRRQFDDFLTAPFVEFLPVSLTTSDRFGLVHAALRRRGTPIPTNDIWIAAHALETGADLLSFDRHFGAIDGLPFVDLNA